MTRLPLSGRGRLARGALFVTLLASGSALADPQGDSEPAAPPPLPAPTATATPGVTTPPTPADEEASTRFKRGLQLFDEGDYTLALVEFERAYELAPNYRALYNIALVDTQLGRYADAMRTFEKYLDDGGDAIAPARRTEVQNTLAQLHVRTATVEITPNVAAAVVWLDGRPVDPPRLRGPMLIDAGEHTLHATAPGYEAADKTFTVAGADQTAIRLDLLALPIQRIVDVPPAPERGRALFWPGFLATGILAAGAIAGGVVVIDARSRLFQEQNTFGSSPATRDDLAKEANTAGLVADILAGVAVITGGVSLYLSLRVDHSPKTVTLSVSPRSVSLSGNF
ncbi:MAG: tetratricopeptide repeat protein [Polyangiaceae bacterium]|nr:tetratricopeptide repeat protein [Polyangiaceae bacterium]